MQKCILSLNKTFVLCLLFISCYCSSSAQESKQSPFINSVWMDGGMWFRSPHRINAITTINEFGAINFGLRKNWLVTLNADAHAEVDNFFMQNGKAILSCGILGGKIKHYRYFSFAGSAGVARVKKIYFDDLIETTEVKEKSGVGIPVQLKGYFTPWKWLGIGATFNSNINQVDNYNALMFSVAIGKIK
jgi:hypothetical protein